RALGPGPGRARLARVPARLRALPRVAGSAGAERYAEQRALHGLSGSGTRHSGRIVHCGFGPRARMSGRLRGIIALARSDQRPAPGTSVCADRRSTRAPMVIRVRPRQPDSRRARRATRIVDSLAAVAEFAGVAVPSAAAW